MSAVSPVKVAVSPVVVKKGSIPVIDGKLQKKLLVRCLKIQKSSVYKDEIIYKSTPDDFLRGEFPNLVLFNRQNIVNSIRTTIARFTSDATLVERSSRELTTVIGQKNYDIIFSALCSVISLELRIRAILALLTVDKAKTYQEKASQVDKLYADVSSQTYESSRSYLDSVKPKSYKRIKRPHFRPYVLPKNDEKQVKRVVIDPKDVKPKSAPKSNENSEKTDAVTKVEHLPDLKEIINEDSNFSDCSKLSLFSHSSTNIPDELLHNIQLRTEVVNSVPLTLLDGSVVMVCAKPMDKFHYATPEILKTLPEHQRRKLMYQQAVIDWKYCMEEDEDGYFPIHHAVMTNDLPFLKSQCVVLRSKHGTVDLMSRGTNMTPLQMTLHQLGGPCTSLLLEHGADPLQQDDEGKSFFHTASEVSHEHLQIALEYCRKNARQILSQDEDLWSPDMEKESDEKLSKFLLDHICVMVDNAGYTPLMLASKQGNYHSTQLLSEASPSTVNHAMPSSGNTALYLAVGAAYMEASNSLNHTKISENFMKTIEILVLAGADPSIENYSGSSVHTLLSDFNIVDLSVLIANKLSYIKFYDTHGNKFNVQNSMLLKSSDGQVNLTDIKTNTVADPSVNVFKDVKIIVAGSESNMSVNNVQYIVSETKKSNTAEVPKFIKILPKPFPDPKVIVEPKKEPKKEPKIKAPPKRKSGGDLYNSVVKKNKKPPVNSDKNNEMSKTKKDFAENEGDDIKSATSNVKNVTTGVFTKPNSNNVVSKNTVAVGAPKTVKILPKIDPNVTIKEGDESIGKVRVNLNIGEGCSGIKPRGKPNILRVVHK